MEHVPDLPNTILSGAEHSVPFTAVSHGPAAEWELQLTVAKSLLPKKNTPHIATPGKKPNSNEEGGFQ